MKSEPLSQDQIKLKINAAWLSLIVGIILFLVKTGAFLITDSKAIFSDAIESIVHIVAIIIFLYSIILSSKPADKSHLYGHGNIEYFSAGIEGFLIIVASITIFYFSIIDLLGTPQPKELDYGTYLIAFSAIVNIFLGYHLVNVGKKTNSIALVADGKHILTDVFTSTGIVIGLIIVLITDYYIIDPIIAMLVAINILFTGYRLIRSSIGGLMMETDHDLLEQISELLINQQKDYIIDIHHLRFWQSAEKVFIDFHMTLPYYFNIKQAHDIEDEISKAFFNAIPNSEIRMHFDFCESTLCKYCNYQKCDVRSEIFSEQIKWDSDKLLASEINLPK
jgi:cation diffusion facilitator family transporter